MSIDFTTPGFTEPVSEAEQFFYEWAGWGYFPDRETPEEGRMRGARQLATAERQARDKGWTFAWEDEPDPMDFHDDEELADWPQYVCDVFDPDGNAIGSLGGITLRDREDPYEGDPYVRVVEAELALEYVDR